MTILKDLRRETKYLAVGALLAVTVRMGIFIVGAIAVYTGMAAIDPAYGRVAAGLILLYSLRK